MLDMSKAYDEVSHSNFLMILLRMELVEVLTDRWLKSYITDTGNRVNNDTDELKCVKSNLLTTNC